MWRSLWRLAAVQALVAALLAGCGGGEGTVFAPQMGQARAQAALDPSACDAQSAALGTAEQVGSQCLRSSPALRLAAVPLLPGMEPTALSPDALFNWAETQFPELFSPAREATQTLAPYTFRHYRGTGNYLGVAGTDVYLMGPMTGGTVARVGSLSDFSCAAAKIGCLAPGVPIITSAERGNGTATFSITPPADTGTGPLTSYAVTCVAGLGSIRSASGPAGVLTLTGLNPGAQYACIASVASDFATSAPSPSYTITMPSAGSFQQTRVSLVSDWGDYIGQGRLYEYTKADAQITATATAGRFSLRIRGDQDWDGDFQLPNGMSRFSLGTYTAFVRYPFNYGSGGLAWSGEGRGCNQLTGSITVHAASYSGDELDGIHLSFEQHCEGGAPALRGTVVWGANDPAKPAGPVNPIPSNLWKPATGAVPAKGNYVYTKGDPGDWVGMGQTLLFTGSQVSSVSLKDAKLSVSVDNGEDYFTGNFIGMESITDLSVGYYGGLQRLVSRNPAKGGMDWFGSGRGCNTLTGWFAIDELVVEAGVLKHVLMRFEQHCEAGVPALRGQLKWTAP